MSTKVSYYPAGEERLNILSHGFGAVMAIPATVFLILRAVYGGTAWDIVSFSVYGASLFTLYLASTLYHASRKESLRKKLNIFDHAAIYVLIAGTYTPFALGPLRGAWGWTIFGLTWGLTFVGVGIKLFFTGRFRLISTISYVLMGWIALIAIKPLIEQVNTQALLWMLFGGVFYTVGAILYQVKKLPYNHGIFHLFVLAGSACHFVAIYQHLL